MPPSRRNCDSWRETTGIWPSVRLWGTPARSMAVSKCARLDPRHRTIGPALLAKDRPFHFRYCARFLLDHFDDAPLARVHHDHALVMREVPVIPNRRHLGVDRFRHGTT